MDDLQTAPAGKFRLIRIENTGERDYERDLGSLESAKGYADEFQGWGWEVWDDTGKQVYSRPHPHPIQRTRFFE